MEIESAQIKSHNGSWLKLMSLVLIPPHKKGGKKSEVHEIEKKIRSYIILRVVDRIFGEWRREEEFLSRNLTKHIILSVADPGEGPGGPGSPLIFKPKWGPKGRKMFVFETAPPYLRVWMTAPPPYLRVWIRQ